MKWLITSLILYMLCVSYAAPVYNGYPQTSISQFGAYVDSLDETAKSQIMQFLAPALADAGLHLVDKLGSKAIKYVADCVIDDCTAQEKKLQLTDQRVKAERLLAVLQAMENINTAKENLKDKNVKMKDDLNAEMQDGLIVNPTTKGGHTLGYPGKFNGRLLTLNY